MYTQLYIHYDPTTSKPKCPEKKGSRSASIFIQLLPVLEAEMALPGPAPTEGLAAVLGPCDDSSTEEQSMGPASNLLCDPTTRRASLAFSGLFSPKSLGKCQMCQNQREGPGSGSRRRQMAVHEPPVGTCRYILISPKHCQHLNINIFQKCRFQSFLLKIRFITAPKWK